MLKRKLEQSTKPVTKKKSCTQFKDEWLREIVEVVMPNSSEKQKVTLGQIFVHHETGQVVCSICQKANAGGDFSSGKKWDEWKLDYLKRHLNHKVHGESVEKLRNKSKGGILKMLTETMQDRETRIELTERKKTKADQVKVMIDSVVLAIKMNASMLSVQDINDHMGKYVKIPQAWRSKNYAFEFVDCINHVIQNEISDEFHKSAFHTLIVDESTDISVQKMLILYVKFRPVDTFVCKTVFMCVLKLTACDAISIVAAIKQFYADNQYDLHKMVMFTSDGASVMLGKNNGVAAILRRDIQHLSEQHCVAHREDLEIDDAWKHVSLMKDIETLLNTVYSMFSRSSVKQNKFEELAKITECDALAFRPLNEVRWLSRHFAVTALLRNYDTLIQYCKEEVSETNDPVSKYCVQKLTDSQVRVALTALNDVLGELTSLCKFFQRSCLTTIDAFQFAKAKICKLRAQYLGETPHWSSEVNAILSSVGETNTAAILRFIERVCNHMDARFPEDELMEWKAFDQAAISSTTDFEFGNDSVAKLVNKYTAFIPTGDDENVTETVI